MTVGYDGSEDANRKRVDQVVEKLRQAEQAHCDKLDAIETRLVAIEAQLTVMQKTHVNEYMLMERIRVEVVKLSRGLGVY